MRHTIPYLALSALLTFGGCAASTTQPTPRPPASVADRPIACCCGYAPAFRGGRCVATTRPAVAAAPTTCPFGYGYGPGMGRGPRGGGRGFGRGAGTQRGMPQAMAPTHALLDQHQLVQRNVKEIPGGVETTTTSSTPAVATLIRTHTKQMKERLESGQPIRMWDPLFVELFRHHDQIRMVVTEIRDGVRVVETSDDPQVTMLIRQHASRGVSEFVAGGFARVHAPTPLPAEYVRP